MTSKHTAGPWKWKQSRGNNIYEHKVFTDHQVIAELDGWSAEETKANAQFIVRACNSHEKLVNAGKDALDLLERIYLQSGGVINGETPLMVYDIAKLKEALSHAEGKEVER